MRNHTNARLLLATAATVCWLSSAVALPARPDFVKVRQADGTSLTVRLVGDERFHYALTPDGFPLVDMEGVYRYARLAADGSVEAGPVKASEPSERTVAESDFLSHADPSSVLDRLGRMHAEEARKYNNKVCASRCNAPGSMRFGDFVAEGSPKVLVVLVEFEDVKFRHPDPAAHFRRMLSEKDFSDNGATGSVLDYLALNSSGKFTPDFEVVGPVMVDRPLSYYGANSIVGGRDINVHELITDLCAKIDPEVDFSRYDNNRNGVLDGIYVIYAGEGEATGGPSWTIWPHCSFFSLLYPDTPFVYDGIRLDTYAISNEWEDERPSAAGVFIHEFCHLLGLPDIYSYSGDPACFTPGRWSVLDMGPYNNERRTPPLYSAFERYVLGWVEPRVLSARDNITLRPIAANDVCIVKVSDRECYLFENRQQTGWDEYIPGHGMLVWHLDYDKGLFIGANDDPEHQRIDLVEADGRRDEESRAGDAFPGTASVTVFGDDTSPSMRSWAGMPLNVMLSEITETDGMIRFRVNGGLTEVAVPDRPEASDIAPWGFVLSWTPVESAADYRVSVRRADGRDELLTALTGGAASFRAEGLEEATTYLCSIQATGPDGFVSAESEAAQVSTPEMSFVFTRPKGLEASTDEGRGFTLRWEPLAEAASYEVSVWGVDEGDPLRLEEGFDGGAELPGGWEQQGCMAMANDSYAGMSKPSLKMAPGSWLQTAAMADDVKEISLWLRGISPKPGAVIDAEALCDGEWEAWGSIAAASPEGRTASLAGAPAGCRAVRLTFRSSGGSVAVDDIALLWGAEQVLVAEPGFSPATAPGESLTVVPASGLTRYRCSVVGLNGALRSLPSQSIDLSLAAAAGAYVREDGASLTTEGKTLTARSGSEPASLLVTDPAGRTLLARHILPGETATFTAAAAGIYIVRIGGKVFKTILR